MFYRLLLALVFLLPCSAAFAYDGNDESEEEFVDDEVDGITEFKNKFLIRFLCNYNFVSFWSSENHQRTLLSNRPVDVGLGFGYKDFYWDFLYALPFTTGTASKSVAFEIGFDFFPGNWWIEGEYRRYSGFNMNDTLTTYVDFRESDAYVSALWMATAEGKFSPRVAYFLDRKQNESAGSAIVGGRIQNTRAVDHSETLDYYEDVRNFRSVWLDGGYSYTWIYDNDMFLNLWGVAGLAVFKWDDAGDVSFMPDVVAKVAWGHIGETWSWNCVMEAEYLPMVFDDHSEQKWISAFKILVVRRF